MRKILPNTAALVCSALLLALWTGAAFAERRLALVIGNSTYKNPSLSLANASNDAADVAATLSKLDFEVIHASDLDKREFDRTLQAFARRAINADAVVFFYAGHAMQYQGRNYLLPTDAELQDYFSLRSEAVVVEDVREALDQAGGIKIMILDACRNNPLAERLLQTAAGGRRSVGNVRGLARIERTTGLVVAYATQSNAVAEDGRGRNSPFTTALIKRMQEPDLELGLMFRHVGADVIANTNGLQVPEISMNFFGEFYLSRSDRVAWDRIKDSGDVALFRDFIRRYPTSVRAIEAQRRIDMLERFAREREDERRKTEQEVERQRAEQLEAERQKLEREAAARRQSDERSRQAELERQRIERESAAARQAELERQRVERESAAAREAEVERLKVAEQARKTREEEACRRESEKLALLEAAGNAREQLVQFEREMTCVHLRPTVQASLSRVTPERPAAAAPTPAVPAPAPAADTPRLIRQAQRELRRLGCYDGAQNGEVGPLTRAAIKKYRSLQGSDARDLSVTEDLVTELKEQSDRVCPLVCGRGQRAQGDVCIADRPAKRPERETTRRREQEKPAKTQRAKRQPEPPSAAARSRARPAPAQASESTRSTEQPRPRATARGEGQGQGQGRSGGGGGVPFIPLVPFIGLGGGL